MSLQTGMLYVYADMLFSSYFDGANASGKPIIATIATLLLLGYTLEYQHLKHHKNFEH